MALIGSFAARKSQLSTRNGGWHVGGATILPCEPYGSPQFFHPPPLEIDAWPQYTGGDYFAPTKRGRMLDDKGEDKSSRDNSNAGERFVKISDESKRPKPWFFEEPSKALIKEIRDWVADTGESHTWRGHTHTRPSVGVPIKYIAKFELTEKFKRAKHFQVCPVCRPESRNFGKREGMIAWFPDEGFIRLIGPDCFAELNKEGHFEALEELDRREKRERDFAFLLLQRAQHHIALSVLKAAQQVAEGLDDFSTRLRYTLTESLNIDLWPHIRTGELQRVERFRESRTSSSDPSNPRIFDSARLVHDGQLDGYRLLDPKAKKIAAGFADPIAFLEMVLSDDDWKNHIEQMEDGERMNLVKKLGAALQSAAHLRALVSDLRGFLSTVNLSTLSRWGSLDACKSPVWGKRDGSVLRIGSSETRTMRVPIPQSVDTDIPAIDGLTAIKPG
jgi:hypothetical protein